MATSTTVAVACVAMFQGVTKDGDRALYFSDGATTRLLIDLPDTSGAGAFFFTSIGNGKVLFSNTSEAAGRELWITDGEPAGTRLLKDINPGVAPSSPGGETKRQLPYRGTAYAWHFQKVGDRLIFPATTGPQGREYWTSDGTAAGTQILADGIPGPYSGATPPFVFSNGAFAVYSPSSGIWATDGTAAQNRLILKRGGPWFGVQGFGTVGRRILFTASGDDLWVTNGAAAGTKQVRGSSSSWYPWYISQLPGLSYALMSIRNSEGNHEVWVTKGTSAGAERLVQRHLIYRNSRTNPFYKVGSNVYFVVTDHALGRELWVTRGTAETTKRAVDFTAIGIGPDFYSFSPLGSKLYLTARTHEGDQSVMRLFVTDGTAAGTRKLSTSLSPTGPVLHLNDRVVFPVGSSVKKALWAIGPKLAAPVKVSDYFSEIHGMENVEIRSPNGVNKPCAQ